MATIQQDIKYFTVGTTFCVEIANVRNNGPDVATGVQVLVTVPAGVTFLSSSVDKGIYNPITKTWSVGSLLPNETVNASLCWTITDDTLQQYSFVYEVSSTDGCDACLDNNQTCVNVIGLSCNDINSCVLTATTPNIYNINGTLTGDRTVDGDAFDLIIESVTQLTLDAQNILVESATDFRLNSITSSYTIGDGAGNNIPVVNNDATEALVVDLTTGLVETLTVSYGAFADDAAASGGSVPVGGHYFNTTNNVMHTRMV
jgi:hypothetical protein